MKALKVILALLVVLVLAVIIALPFFLKDVIVKSAPVVGQKVMGVPVSLGDVNISLWNGQVHLSLLSIGNPAGFSTDHAFKVKTIDVAWETRSLLTKMIVIKNITVDAPDIIYEQALSGNNFGKIMDNLKKPAAAGKKETKAAEQPSSEPETKVVIDLFLIKNGQVNVSMPGMGSTAAPIPLPEIRMTEIGRDTRGATVPEVVNQVFTAIFDSLQKALLSTGNVVGKGLVSAGEKTTAAASEGAEAVVGTVQGAGKAAGDAAGQAVGELKGLFGGK